MALSLARMARRCEAREFDRWRGVAREVPGSAAAELVLYRTIVTVYTAAALPGTAMIHHCTTVTPLRALSGPLAQECRGSRARALAARYPCVPGEFPSHCEGPYSQQRRPGSDPLPTVERSPRDAHDGVFFVAIRRFCGDPLECLHYTDHETSFRSLA